jgi:hypothetical protein
MHGARYATIDHLSFEKLFELGRGRTARAAYRLDLFATLE